MTNSIFIGNNFVWGIEYENKDTPIIKKYVEIPIKEGSIINGNIINIEEIVEKLKVFKNDHGFESAVLLLDTSEVQSVSILVPNLKKLEYQRLAESELNREYELDRTVHYKIVKNSSGEGRILFAATVPNSIIESYKDLFASVGIKLKAIKILEEAVDAMYETDSVVPEENAIINIISNDIMYTAMYVKGKRFFSQRTRLGLDDNGIEYELGNNLANLEQFNKAQRNSDPDKVYYVGISIEELERLKAGAFVDIPMEIIDLDAYMEDEIKGVKINPVFMGIFDNNSLNLFKRIKTADELAESNMSFVQKTVLGVVAIAMAVSVVMGGVLLFHSTQLRQMYKYINDPINVSDYQEVNESKMELLDLETVIAQLQAVEEYIGEYNIVEIPLMEDIQLIADGESRLLSMSFDQANNIVSATLETKNASSASDYVRELKRVGFNVSDINYVGYTESNPHIYIFVANIIPENNKEVFQKSIDYTYADKEPTLEENITEDETTSEVIGDETTKDDAVVTNSDTESVGGVDNE